MRLGCDFWKFSFVLCLTNSVLYPKFFLFKYSVAFYFLVPEAI